MSIELTTLIREQAGQCLVMAGAGIVFMIFYRFFGILSGRAGLPGWVCGVLELVFWLAAAVITFQFLYYCAYGRISVHSICAFAAGVLLWRKCFCGIILPTECEGKRTRGLRKRHGKKKKEQAV